MSMTQFLEAAVLNLIFRQTAFAPSANLYVSLHTADPGETSPGGSELTGGAGPYARQQAAFNAASSGNPTTIANTSNIVFAGLPAATVSFLGIWDSLANGNFYWGGPLGATGFGPRAFAAEDTVAGNISSAAHGFVANDQVVFYAENTGTMPTGLTAGTLYYVIAAGLTTDVFRVSATLGGSAIVYSATGNGTVQKCVPKVLNAGDSFQVSAAALSIALG